MTYCVMCSTPMLERTVSGHKVLLCSSCGAMLLQVGENKYKYMGTTHGNQQLRELLAVIDKKEESK